MKLLKDLYDQIYSNMPKATAEYTLFLAEQDKIIAPLKTHPDFNELADIILDMSGCSQEFGFISGFKCGIAFLMECMENME